MVTQLFYCKLCEKDTNWKKQKKGKRWIYVCCVCHSNTRGIDGFIKSSKAYEEKLFTIPTAKLMEDKNLRFLEEKDDIKH